MNGIIYPPVEQYRIFDGDKHYYPEVYRKVAGRVRVGGIWVADNDKRYYSTIMPLRDGVAIGIRMK